MKLFTNGRIRTMNAQQPFASAMAVANGRILAIGTDEEIHYFSGWNTTEENLGGAVVWPGLTDAHLHLDHYTRSLNYVNCETSTRSECIDNVAQRCQSTPSGQWVRGHGWNQNDWAEGFGDALLLDEISDGHPVYLTAKSLHASWANSLALQMAGITSQTPDPEGGQIGRDARGNPNGLLFENAMALFEKNIPELTPAELLPLLVKTQEKLWSLGLTGVHDFDGINCFAALQALDGKKMLKIRVVKSIPYKFLQQAAELKLRSGFGSDFLRIGSVKLFADGALGPRTASMLQPYENETDYRGIALLDSEEIFEIGRQAALSGLSLATHAIGDLANHEAINGYAQIRSFEQQEKLPPTRHRIEHVQIIHPDDLPRLKELGLIASMQPLHATSDMYISDRHWGERSKYAYALNSMIQLGTSYAFGSDAPVESPNPFFGLHAAVTRTRQDGSPGPAGWHSEQKISLLEALYGYTTGAAYAGHFENDLGQLSVGYCADFIVLNQDPFSLSPAEIYQLSPQSVAVGGEWVWRI
jgi:predicted amidohydrolase YtcJ